MKLFIGLGAAIFLFSHFGCTRNEVVADPTPPGDPFNIPAWDYSTSHYFVDTTYISFYEPYYVSTPPVFTVEMVQSQILEEEVWVEFLGPNPSGLADAIRGIAYITLPERGGGYDSTLRTQPQIIGGIESGRFIRLRSWEYTLMADGYLGVLTLEKPLLDQQAVGIAYRRRDGKQFGEFSRDAPYDTTAVPKPRILKMVKPRNLQSSGPLYPVAWRQLVKSIYSLNMRSIERRDFWLDIRRRTDGPEVSTLILGRPLLHILLLDRFTSEDEPVLNGDGLFDFLPGRTVDLDRGEIIFPKLRPFDKGIQQYFAERGVMLEDTSAFLFPEMYDTTKSFSQVSPRNKYFLTGRAFHN